MTQITRRRVLRGLLNGMSVSVALPLLDCFLDGNGTALASGSPMPVRFGTWFWGLGATNAIFVPKKQGAGFDLPVQLAPIAPVREHLNVFTNLRALRDGEPNLCHHSGWIVGRAGVAPKSEDDKPGETLDITVANQIGRTTRFRTLTATAAGDIRNTVSYESGNAPNPPEVSPLGMYARLFGPQFQDPNAATFTPDPAVMARRSVLSGVMGEIGSLERTVGSEDRQRLDEYFTGLRHLEQQFDQQLTKPQQIAACHAPPAFEGEPRMGNEESLVAARHRMLTQLMVMAVACDQTRVFNMTYSDAFANTTQAGYEKPHHTTTHEERIDEKCGYQPHSAWFSSRAIEAWAGFVQAFAAIREGDGTLLDNLLIYAHSDHGEARVHSLDRMVAFTAGRAGGRIRTGLHIDGAETSITRVGYTALRGMNLDVPSWGARSNNTSAAFTEILSASRKA